MLMNAYCEQNNLKVKQWNFIFNNSVIDEDGTPDSHEMVSGDQIKATLKKKKPEVPTSQKPKDPIKKKSPSSQSPRPKSNDENGTSPSPQNPSKKNHGIEQGTQTTEVFTIKDFSELIKKIAECNGKLSLEDFEEIVMESIGLDDITPKEGQGYLKILRAEQKKEEQ